MNLKIGSLFSGIGGLDLAVEEFFDAQTAWHCEWDEEPSKVLTARWPGVPNHRDVRTVDWASVEPVDIMCGGFPCQDVSLAGRRAGMKEGTRSGLWSEFANAIDIVRPKVVVIENVRGLLSADAGSNVEPCPWCMGDGADEYHLRALDAVVADLSDLGFDAEWTGLRAADVGAPHGRFRFFLLAYARGVRFDSRWDAASRQTQGGRASAVAGGRADAPLTLLPTPIVSDGTGGPKNLDGAQFAPQLREIKKLLPTPTARDMAASGGSTPSDVTLTDAVVRTELGRVANTRHAGTSRAAQDRLLPTPRAARGASGAETMYRLGAERDDTGDRQGNVTFKEKTSGTTIEERSGEALRDLRGRDGEKAIQREIVGPDPVPQPEDMLAVLREHAGDRADGLVPVAGAADTSADALCGVFSDEISPRSPHRPGPIEQCAGEPRDTVCELSPEASLAGRPELRNREVDWGDYADAVRTWESILRRPAPAPTRPDGKNGNHRLNAEFVSWMMGYPAGWVTDILKRNPAIKACGNGVVPQQASAALSVLWARVLGWVAAS